MRSHLHIAASAALLAGTTVIVQAHPGCYTADETPTMDVSLAFCQLEDDGTCCTPTQESDAMAVFNQPGALTGQCAEDYAKVACGPCSAYAGHLYERLGAELGVSDGMTMKTEFCNSMVSACAGQIAFPSYDGGSTSYCDKHVGGSDLIWSFPIDESETTFESSGLTKAFPDLNDESDLPRDTIAMHMTPDGSRWWLAGQDGDMREVSSDNPSSSTEILDLANLSIFFRAFEEGLLDFAFDPNFHTNNVFYVSYTVENNGRFNRMSKFTDEGNSAATLASEEIVLESAEKDTSIHSAGWCGFKPSAYANPSISNDLYWAIGDGGPQEDTLGVGQNLDTLLGKIVRISVSGTSTGYTSPSGNMGGGLPEICASGFRNPFRCGFDRETDELYCGDVGHTLVEELDLIVCGQNYGWSTFEGSRCQEAQEGRIGDCNGISRAGYTFPIYEYCHPDYDSSIPEESEFTGGNDLCGSRAVEGLAVIGGYPYRGQRFSDVLTGALLFADAQKKNLYYLIDEGNGEWVPGTIIGDGSTSIISFAEDNDGEQYVITSDRVPHMLPCGDLCATTCLTQAETQPVYTSLGCFGDFGNDRALSLGSSAACSEGQDLMSPAICASYCATISGSTLFGVEFAYECFCGGASDDYDKHGSVGMDQCETLCTGTPDEFCGGRNAIEVYSFSEGVAQTPAPIGDIAPSPTVDPNTDYALFGSGCFVDDKTNRVLAILASTSNTNTVESCAALCLGSTYFGLEFGTECFCSAAGDDPDGLGPATCAMACTGDPSQICGDRGAITVYEYGEATITPTPTAITPTPTTITPTPTATTFNDYQALGCYADAASPRVFTAGVTKNTAIMAPELCAAFCAGNAFFGLQYGHECWCGGDSTDVDINGPGTCDTPCVGDAAVTCGGSFAFNAYAFTDIIIISPTPTAVTTTDLGCYEDSKSARIMGSLTTDLTGMSVEVCSSLCASIYFGLQYGVECWCSDTTSFEAIGTSTSCDLDCSGNISQNCGGYNAMRVYQNA